ncbi:GIY-YIG nuclease family protein [Candidatus Babeliales bacterium]|nr:GIY-YIG nuclease family protein [Candidatus Babeliales bacterium]
MNYVYLLRSIPFPKQTYVGQTDDLKARFKKHNEGGSIHTAKYKPWKLVIYLGFCDYHKALAFEKYLKSGSGRELAKKRLW